MGCKWCVFTNVFPIFYIGNHMLDDVSSKPTVQPIKFFTHNVSLRFTTMPSDAHLYCIVVHHESPSNHVLIIFLLAWMMITKFLLTSEMKAYPSGGPWMDYHESSCPLVIRRECTMYTLYVQNKLVITHHYATCTEWADCDTSLHNSYSMQEIGIWLNILQCGAMFPRFQYFYQLLTSISFPRLYMILVW